MAFSRRSRSTRRVKPKSVTRKARRSRSRMTMRKRAFPVGKNFVTVTDEYRVEWSPNNAYQPIVSLNDGNHARALLLAGEFQQIKLMKVELVIEQNYNQYPENAVSISVDAPQLYHMNWRNGSFNQHQLSGLGTTFFDGLGLKPQRFTSNKTLIYDPVVYVPNAFNGYNTIAKKAPWMPCNDMAPFTAPLTPGTGVGGFNTMTHYGKLFYVDQVTSSTVVGNAPRTFRVRCTWAFRGKNLYALIPSPS